VKVKSKRKSNNAVLQCNEKIQLKISNRIGNFCFPIKAYYMISEKMKLADNHIISFLKVLINTLSVGMTGFEPATTRPPAECATGLRYIPKIFQIKLKKYPNF
jgi:hypothetical protein